MVQFLSHVHVELCFITHIHMYTLTEIQNAYRHAHEELKIYNCPYPPRNGASKGTQKNTHPIPHARRDLTHSLGRMLHVMFRYACFTAGLLERFARLWDLA